MWSNISPSDSSLLPLSHFYSRSLARCLKFFADRYYSYYSYYHSKYVQMGSLPSVVIKELRIVTPKEQNYVYSNFAQVAGNPDSSFIWIQCFCPLAAWNNDKLLQVLFLPDTWEQSLLQENQILTIQQTLAVSREWGGEWQVLDIPLNLAPKDFEFWTQLSTTHITLGAPSPPAECIKIRRTYSQQYTFAYLNESSCMQYLGTLHFLGLKVCCILRVGWILGHLLLSQKWAWAAKFQHVQFHVWISKPSTQQSFVPGIWI